MVKIMPDVGENEKLAAEIEKLSSAALRVVAALSVKDPVKEEPSSHSFPTSLESAASSVLDGVAAIAVTESGDINSLYIGVETIKDCVLKGTPEEIDRNLVQLAEGANKAVERLIDVIDDIGNYEWFRERLGAYIGVVKREKGEEIKEKDKEGLMRLIIEETDAYLGEIVKKIMQDILTSIRSELRREGDKLFEEIKEKKDGELLDTSFEEMEKISSEIDGNKIWLAIFKSNMALAMIKEEAHRNHIRQIVGDYIKTNWMAHGDVVCGVIYDEAERYIKEKQLAAAGVGSGARVPDAIGGAGAVASPMVAIDGGVLKEVLDSSNTALAAATEAGRK